MKEKKMRKNKSVQPSQSVYIYKKKDKKDQISTTLA